MNQDSSQPGFELPPPMSDNSESATAGYEAPTGTPEQSLSPLPGNPSQQATPAPAQPLPQASPVAPIPPTASQQGQNVAAPMSADDNDLIEKEWVIKAKQIVSATKDDPYTQNKEMSKFKADYLKKRYNKDIKVEDS